MSRFDLHLHTNNSDGSDTPEELIQKVCNANIDVFAITDHDTIEGLHNIQNLIPKNKIFVNGIELTCKTDNIKCHILGYHIDPYNNKLNDLIKKGKILRKNKLETRIKYLKDKWNIKLNQDELDWLYSRKSVVKTHIANILVNRGLSNNNIDAMKKYIDGCKSGDTRFDGNEAVNTIIEAGGIPIWAHPLGGEGEVHLAENEFLQKLHVMIKSGIKGIECYYSRYSMQEIAFLEECAIKYNLIKTGGSDYHGSNKTVKLGMLNNNNIYIDSEKISLKY